MIGLRKGEKTDRQKYSDLLSERQSKMQEEADENLSKVKAQDAKRRDFTIAKKNSPLAKNLQAEGDISLPSEAKAGGNCLGRQD